MNTDLKLFSTKAMHAVKLQRRNRFARTCYAFLFPSMPYSSVYLMAVLKKTTGNGSKSPKCLVEKCA